jgi:radical SAM superfamily enzyme YgiQ (UPF0313 family)
MSKGLLVSYAGYPAGLSSLFPDNGLASLAAVLIANGHECEVIDNNTTEVIERLVDPKTRGILSEILPRIKRGEVEGAIPRLIETSAMIEERASQAADEFGDLLAERCLRSRVDFVGFKLWSGDGFEATIRIARKVRASCPRIKLFAGGPGVHYSQHVVASEAPMFDAVVDGEGEESLLELARFVEGRRGLEGIPNLLGRPGSTAALAATSDLSTLPTPVYARDVYPSFGSGQKLRLISIDESRGCPMSCAFCINCCIEGSRWRTRNAKQVVREMAEAKEILQTNAFRLAGTYSPPRLVRQICEEILARRLDVRFGLFLHARGFEDDLLALLHRAGCHGLFVGVESGSDDILERAMGKKISAAGMRTALRRAMNAGLFIAASFIEPTPFGTEKTESETRDFVLDLFAGSRRATVNVCFPALIPRTLWWRERDRFGFTLDVDEDEYRRIILRYKIRHLVPSSLWAPLPYRLDGLEHHELTRRTTAFQAWLRRSQIVVNSPDHDALICEALGLELEGFVEEIQRCFFVGDARTLQEIVDQTNQTFSA